MNHRKFESNDEIRMILNVNKELVHSNLNNEASTTYLERLGVLNNMPSQSCFKNEDVLIDKFILNDKPYYLVIAIKRDKCSSCTRVLKDGMTGLYNRNYLEFIRSEALHINTGKYFSLILIDIDNLKMINDTYGHLVGDKAIKIVGQAIRRCIR